MDVSFRTELPHSSFTFTHKKCSHVCFCFCETSFVALFDHITCENELRYGAWASRFFLEEEGHWHMITADVRVGVSLCIIDEQNGNKNMPLVWTVTPGSDPTEFNWGFYTHSMMNVFKLRLLSLPTWLRTQSRSVCLRKHDWKKTNMIKIGDWIIALRWFEVSLWRDNKSILLYFGI